MTGQDIGEDGPRLVRFGGKAASIDPSGPDTGGAEEGPAAPAPVQPMIIRPTLAASLGEGLPHLALDRPVRRLSREAAPATGPRPDAFDWSPAAVLAIPDEASAYTGQAYAGRAVARPRKVTRLVSFGAPRRGGGLRHGAMALLGLLAALPLMAVGSPPAARLDGILDLAGIGAAFAALAVLLGRRGWSGGTVLLALLGLAAGPVALAMASGGQDLLRAGALLFLLALMLDRIEAVGDGRALMGLGFALAALLGLAPAMAPLGLLALALLPVASKDMRNLQAAVALYGIVWLPVIGVAAALALLAPGWLGLVPPPPLSSARATVALLPWLRGNPAAPMLTVAALLAVVPALLMVLHRLRRVAGERARPVTALFALAIGPVALLADAMLMRPGALLAAATAALAGIFAWVVSTPLRAPQRRRFAGWLWLGAATGWAMLLLARGSAMAELLAFLG